MTSRFDNQKPTQPCFAMLATLLLLAAPLRADEAPAFKVYVEHSGVYRIAFEDLAAAGLDRGLASAGLGMTRAGEAVPIWIEDGGDGVFGPGDRIELVAERLRGEYSYSSEYSRYNVYFLRFGQERPARMTSPKTSTTRRGSFHAYRRQQHLEEDLVILRLPPAGDGKPEELWYWAKMAYSHSRPFVAPLDLHDLESAAERTVDQRIQFRGWSQPRSKPDPETADHRVDVSILGEHLATAEWNGTRPYSMEVSFPPERLVAGDNTLELKVPTRSIADGQPLVDVVMLNWIEISYPRTAWVGDAAARFELADPAGPHAMRLLGPRDQRVVVYGDRGSRITSEAMTRKRSGDHREWRWKPPPGESSFVAAEPGELRRPEAVVSDHPSRLADTGNRADYILITHRTLRQAISPLADLHRSRGLEVKVVDVEDVYDEFSHGVTHPQALRSFIAHAYHRWQRPAPRFVLLVGDASWDGKNEQAVDANYADWIYRHGESETFPKNTSTPYSEGAELNRRHLIPTWNHTTYQGHSASDNYFVAVDGDDSAPDLAIGRFPVVEPQEVAQIVAKTTRYAVLPEAGPWRRNALFITNESQGFQRQSDRLALELTDDGFTPRKVYPASSETSNEHHTAQLIEAFDEGQLFVHFLGHGGRYIWRTGPPDYRKNHDLFTLDHLDELAPTDRLPVVLSLTCYTAPFDHPSADSIGEKLLRIADRGAVAVLAASWRNSPSSQWGKVLLEELTEPGATVGEAVMRAKHRIPNRDFVETYNLLGDPAVPVALPVYKNTVKWKTASELDNFGFDVYRGRSPEGPFERINRAVIEGAGTTDEPQSYRYVDDAVDPHETYYYYVESISMSGIRERFTPVGEAGPKIPPQDPGGAG